MISKLFNKLFGGKVMTPEQENYKMMEQIRKDMIRSAVETIYHRIEKVCRYHDDVVVTDHGFDKLSMINYESSIQKEIVEQLTKDGYVCKICVDFVDNNPISYLKVSW